MKNVMLWNTCKNNDVTSMRKHAASGLKKNQTINPDILGELVMCAAVTVKNLSNADESLLVDYTLF